MSINTALTTMMARQLEKLGYPSDDVRFSLGYCQGDGASFTGTLDIEKLGPRLVPKILPAIWSELKENADQHEELTLSPGRDRYVHERSTSLSESARSVEGTAAEVYGGPTHIPVIVRSPVAPSAPGNGMPRSSTCAKAWRPRLRSKQGWILRFGFTRR